MRERVSLAELAAADIQLRPVEAVAIVSEICRRCAAGALRGVPPAGVIRLTRDGDLVVEGPMTTGDDVARAALLLNQLLAGFDAVPEYRASGALRLVIARAMGTLDLPPYGSLAEFCSVLVRFTGADPGHVIRGIFEAWERARAARELREAERTALTISDIRRARRATGMSLEQVSLAAEVPATQLRDLEWGYMRNWRADGEGRAQVVRYARAAGLDEGLVLSIAWPLIIDAARFNPAPQPVTALVPSGPQHVVSLRPAAPHPAPWASAHAHWIAAAAAAVLVAASALVLERRTVPDDRSTRTVALPADAIRVGTSARASATLEEPTDEKRVAPANLVTPVTPAVRAVSSRPRPAGRRTAGPAAGKRRAQRSENIFEREWIRFVFR